MLGKKLIAISPESTTYRRYTTVLGSIIILIAGSLVASCASKGIAILQEQPNTSLKMAQLHLQADDLPFLRTVDLSTGLVFRTYYDSISEKVARTSISTIVDMYREVAYLVAADPGMVNWAAIAFIQNSEYIPPRQGGEVRWGILVDDSGQLGAEGIWDFYLKLPHEQVHALQGTFKPGLPRWFSEGMAEWAGLQVSQRREPALAEQKRMELRNAHETLDQPLDLSGWGGVTVNPEAIIRQVTIEQRLKMEADSTYSPPGPFSFGPDDLISDESNTLARYGGSLALFEMLEETVGQEQMRSWFHAVWQANGRLNTETLISLAYEHMGIDLQPWFKR
ncbi:MAG: hypothetical protein H0X63_07240 [Flavobacteriales bacterium]|nr:hypothetical protein [Flavobacteriales bacterium]